MVVAFNIIYLFKRLCLWGGKSATRGGILGVYIYAAEINIFFLHFHLFFKAPFFLYN